MFSVSAQQISPQVVVVVFLFHLSYSSVVRNLICTYRHDDLDVKFHLVLDEAWQ